MLRRHLAAFRPIAVYLFGSCAKGTARADSDLDIAFLPGAQADPYDVFLASQAIADELKREVDLVDLSRASVVMRVQVISTGRRVIAADECRVDEFEMYAFSDYARLNEQRREVLAGYGGLGNA